MSPLVFTLRSSADFLFRGWHIDTYFGLSVTMLSIVAVGMIFEGFQSFRSMHLRARTEKYKRCCPNTTKRRAIALRTHVERSLMHMLHVTVGYLLMLCAMSYNVWIMACVAIGAGLGFLFVRPVVLHWLEKQEIQENENRKPDEKSTELKVKFINGVNEKKEETKSCPLVKLNGENTDTCA